MPVQTHRFGWSMARSLRSAGIEVVAFGFLPAADFPHCSRIRFGRERYEQDGVLGTTLPFYNLTGLKHLSRFVSVRRALRQWRGGAAFDAVLIHGVHSPLLWAGLNAGKIRGVPVVTVLTDPPSTRTALDNLAATALKVADRRLIGAALARMDGVVALADGLATDFAPGLPTLLMEGIAADPLEFPSSTTRMARHEVVYAGSLNAEYGVLDLLEAVTRSAGQWRLAVYGRGPLEDLVRERARQSARVHFGGMADAQQLQSVYEQARLLVNPRPPNTMIAGYSFPSKILEYMASGTAVLTTRLPGIPADYEPHVTFSEPGAAGLARAIDRALQQPDVLADIGAGGRDFILTTRGHAAQGERLRGFLQDLAADVS